METEVNSWKLEQSYYVDTFGCETGHLNLIIPGCLVQFIQF